MRSDRISGHTAFCYEKAGQLVGERIKLAIGRCLTAKNDRHIIRMRLNLHLEDLVKDEAGRSGNLFRDDTAP